MTNDLTSTSSAAYETQSLSKLKQAASRDPNGQIKQVAKQFEGVFVNMMLKSMRQALPKGGVLDSQQTEMYTSMYDQQLAQNLSAKGLGMADMMVKQLTAQNKGQQLAPGTGTTAMPLNNNQTINTSLLNNEVLKSMPIQAMEHVLRKTIGITTDNALASSTTSVDNSQMTSGSQFADSGEFLSRLSQAAKIASEQSGIPHQLILAQAALESGWGQREIPTSDGKPSHNIFGVKAGSSWSGPTTEIMTTEYEDGVAQKVPAKFRVYGSYVEAISDYVHLLTRNPRFSQVASAGSAEKAAQALQQAGYATDPSYSRKLINIIQKIKGTGEEAVKAYTHDLNGLF
jgi:flagellar protein FlgJ